jgi:vacuolar-type H+-ATPase subunit I/STV1
MATPHTLARLDKLIWSLIYVGLFMLVLGIATHEQMRIAGWSLGVIGSLLAIAGAVLIFVRARLRETPEPGAQSKP